jgi:hypothetical protein
VSASQDLRKALELFGPNGENWCKGSYQLEGASAEPQYCSAGVLARVAMDSGDGRDFSEALDLLESLLPNSPLYYLARVIARNEGKREVSIPKWNDTHDFDAVRAAFVAAIALAESEGN